MASWQVRLLSAPGMGAIHIIQLEGEGLWSYLGKNVRSIREGLISAECWQQQGRVSYAELLFKDGTVLDDVMVVVKSVVNHQVWLTVHGNVLISEAILASCRACGAMAKARLSEPAADPFRAQEATLDDEVKQAVIGAQNSELCAFFLAQRSAPGGLGRWIERALVSPPSPEQVAAVLSRQRLGCRLRSAPRVVIAGAPNAGKSTLFNRLLARRRVVESEQPGTTRDLIVEEAWLGPYPIHLIDGAGLRESTDPIEQAGVAKMIKQLQQCDLILHLRRAQAWSSPSFLARSSETSDTVQQMTLQICSQADQITDSAEEKAWAIPEQALKISALTGQGMTELVHAVQGVLFGDGTAFLQSNAVQPVPFTKRQVKLLEAAQQQLLAGGSADQEFMALRGARSAQCEGDSSGIGKPPR